MSTASLLSIDSIHISWPFFFVTLTSLITTINPLGATSFFLNHSTASSLSSREVKQVAKKASLTCFFLLTFFALTGRAIFQLLGISMTAFQIAGGIFVFMIGLEMLRGAHVRTRTLPEEQAEARTKEDISLIPLAIPLLAGPGAITMVIVLMGKAVGFWASAMVVFLISIVSLLSYGILRRSSMLIRLAGPSGVRVMNRVMGLILSAIAVQILINGLKGLAPEVLLSLNLASMGGH